MSSRIVRGTLLSVILLLLIMGDSLLALPILVGWGLVELGLVAHRTGRAFVAAYFAFVAVGTVFFCLKISEYRNNLQLISLLRETGGTHASVSVFPGPIDYISLGSDVGDQELEEIVSMDGLENVESVVANDCGITDKGLLALVAFKKLSRVYVGQTEVTPEGVEEFQELLPDCQVVYDPD